MKKANVFWLALAVFVAMGATAAASVYLTKQSLQAEEEKPVAVSETKTKTVKRKNDDIVWNNPRPAQPQQPQPVQVAANNCDDRNIVGTLIGGAAGAFLGNQIGDGGGRTAATIGGTLGGAYLGNSYIPTRNVTGACLN